MSEMKWTEQIGELMTALSVAQLDFKEVVPTRTGRVRKGDGWINYKYADLADCKRATREALAQHGLTVAQPRVMIDGNNGLATILAHGKSGQYIIGYSSMLPRNPGNPQDVGTTVTYDRRYSYSSMIGLFVLLENQLL